MARASIANRSDMRADTRAQAQRFIRKHKCPGGIRWWNGSEFGEDFGCPEHSEWSREPHNHDGQESAAQVRIFLISRHMHPPRYTLETLRYEIDSVLGKKGCYDLLYLPVDSAKMTNRGYAFINFSSAVDVGLFVRAFLDRPWSEMNKKSKAAALYWAYVQGKDSTLAHINTGVE